MTADGSKTLLIEAWEEQYHSMHGAVQEAYHVFIKNGLELLHQGAISILEIGFGTALNALITFLEAQKHGFSIHYTGVEAFPVTPEEADALQYPQLFPETDLKDAFAKMHASPWEIPVSLAPHFELTKKQCDFLEIEEKDRFDLVYFDAFGARVQPELWTEVIFEKMFLALKKGGVLVTYAAKGSVRRGMQAVGFTVERLPGPPGKREMLRATKPI